MLGAVLYLTFAFIYNTRRFGNLLHFFDQLTAITLTYEYLLKTSWITAFSIQKLVWKLSSLQIS
jgi:hypothetical protein